MSRVDSSVPTTLAALLTPTVAAAIATIALRGPLAFGIVARAFRTASGDLARLDVNQARYGRWHFLSDDIPPEHIVLCRTGELEFEIHCHGGLAICKLILDDLGASECQICHWSQWSTSGLGTFEQAAELALQHAATPKVAAVLLDQAQGCLGRELEEISELIRSGQRVPALTACKRLLERAPFGLRLLSPWRLTLTGPPNAGKSSLTNALVGASRVLVHHEPGTTRDAVDTPIVVSSWPVIITDTAGVRAAQESIEQQGIDTAWLKWQAADIGLLVVDASVGWTTLHDQLIEQRSEATLIVLNKQDLQPACAIPTDVSRRVRGLKGVEGPIAIVSTRAKQADGVHQLLTALGDHFDALMPPSGSAVPFLNEHVAMLKTLMAMLTEDRLGDAEQFILQELA